MLTWLSIFYIRKRDLFDSPMKIKICFKLAFFPVTWGHPSGVKIKNLRNQGKYKGKTRKRWKKNLNSFIERWSNVPYSPLTEATFIEIENLRKHIQKGCLSEIPPGCGTERNEGLHILLNRSMISGATTLSVQLATALLTLLLYHHNVKISAEKHFCS